ncbi:hypothetical protein AgCh_011864 [Apium graveolens]
MGSSAAANLWVLLGLGIAGIFIMTKKIKKTIQVDFGAFVERFQLLPPPQPAPPKAPHPLTGFSFDNNTVSVSSLLAGASDNTGSGIARRIVIKTSLNVILACNIPKDNPMLEAWSLLDII